MRCNTQLAALSGLLLIACNDVPTTPQAVSPPSPVSGSKPHSGSRTYRLHESRFVVLASLIPGFGGYYWDQEGNMHAYLTDVAIARLHAPRWSRFSRRGIPT